MSTRSHYVTEMEGKNVDIDFGCVLRFGDYNLQSNTQQVKQQWGKESMTLVVFFYFPFFSFSFVLVFFSHFIYTHTNMEYVGI